MRSFSTFPRSIIKAKGIHSAYKDPLGIFVQTLSELFSSVVLRNSKINDCPANVANMPGMR